MAIKNVEDEFHNITMKKVYDGEIAEREKEARIKSANSVIEEHRRKQLEDRRIQRELEEKATRDFGLALKTKAIQQLDEEERKAAERKKVGLFRNVSYDLTFPKKET